MLSILLENSISEEGKKISTGMLGSIATNFRKCEDGVYDELCEALKNAFYKYAKDYPDNNKLDKTSLSYLIDAIALVGVRDFGDAELSIPINHLFMNGYIGQNVINEEDTIDGICDGGWDCEKPITDVRELLFPKNT